MMVDCPQYPRPLALPWRWPTLSLPRQARRLPFILLGLLCFTAPPCIGRNCQRPRQSECESNLKSLFTGLRTQQSYPEGRPPTLAEIGFAPERGNRYAYFLAPGPMEQRTGPEPTGVKGAVGIGVDLYKFPRTRPLTLKHLPPALASQVGMHGTCPSCEFVMACAGDVDNNPLDTPDIWTIATMDRVIDGVPVAAGEPYNHVNDLEAD